ncbi:DUF5696 domain-containing protein [Fervidobacterium islandicum]|uniref:DUF5696 domain-containing protein n=1 Tax=Fervidobacterium islandicum TaxID=2423 RepID=A0AAJ5I6N1_FERIS|nr:DUF5696 domain-containing protein [Fervidobacterium islandicum]UOE96815.1 DUF5696 domain-containing protein [Fervidobacterium islandicum]
MQENKSNLKTTAILSLFFAITTFVLSFSSAFAQSIQTIGNDYLSNRFTRPETIAFVKSPFTLDGYTKIAESSDLELWFNLETTSLRVVDKRSGYIWGDVSEETDAYKEMNATYQSIARSLVLLEYFDERGISNVVGSADEEVKKSWKKIQNGIIYSLFFEPLEIRFDVRITVKDDTIKFELPQNTIKEGSKFTMASVVFAPFLGSTISDEINGYAFVPDGPGALIRFSKPAHYLNWFEKRVYGKDYAIENLVTVNDLRANRPNDFLREEPTALIPVFGIVHGVDQNAFLGIITSGQEYSAIISYPSGLLSNYNWTSAKFIYRQKYLQPTTRSGAGIQVAQKYRNIFDAALEISFLTGKLANYVGMAKYYRDKFADQLFGKVHKYENQTNATSKSDVPLYLSVIVSDIEKMLIGQRVIAISSVEQIKQILKELTSKGINRIVLLIEGWQDGGLHGNKVGKFGLEKKTGDFLDLLKYVVEFNTMNKSNGKSVELYFVDNVTKVTEKQLNLRKEVGLNLSQSIITEERDNKDLWLYKSYYVRIDLASEYLSMRVSKLLKLGFKNFAVREYANKLYGNLKMNAEIHRFKAKKLVEKTLSDISSITDNLILFEPNDYTWKYADTIGSAPMNSSQYLFETDTVPFLQIVLSGRINYFTPYMNNGFFSKMDVLKSIDYGAYPSFLITWLDNASLKDTPLWDYPSTRYEDWKEKIAEIYKTINSVLKYVKGSKIVDRIVLKPGVVKVVYDNGYEIYVNYTKEIYKDGSVTVPAESPKVVKSINSANGVGSK